MGTSFMSSSDVVRALAIVAVFGAANAQDPQVFTCPASIAVTATAAASAPWHSESAKAEHKFLRPSIYNGAPGKQEYELAPDEQEPSGKQIKQSWKLSDYRDMNLFVRCRYAGTP